MKVFGCRFAQNCVDQDHPGASLFGRILSFFHISFCSECSDHHHRDRFLNTRVFGCSADTRKNGYQHEIVHKSRSVQRRLASFPEMYSNPILELEKSGRVSYQNPAYFATFPTIDDIHTSTHTIFHELKTRFADLTSGKISELLTEVEHEGTFYAKKAQYFPDLEVLRVFYFDITQQKHYQQIIHQKNKEITDSIQYAKRIQDAILPSEQVVASAFPDSFILYKPKDIVAGDFYWHYSTGDHVYIAAADCTGHGVPGALVSVVCNNALNRSIKEFGERETGRILDRTRELVLESLLNHESNVRDGMDISLVCYNKKTGEVTWSGANNPLWYVSEGNVRELRPDKQHIGHTEQPAPFKTHTLSLNRGDSVFLFSDGYADQFGGEKGKKFMYRQLRNLIQAHAGKSMRELKQILDDTFTSWKGPVDQTDDVLLMGLRF